jgi:type VI secretion system protein ImpA
MTLEIAQLLEELSADDPCGDDLEYDPAFVEMEIAAQGKAEQEFGDTLVEAEEPDWREVKDKALSLLERSKDLRPAVNLARASLNTTGFGDFSQSLALIHGLLDKFWDGVHPQLDPDDDNDPTMRVNSLAPLADNQGLLRDLRRAPLAASRMMGSFCLRDLAIAKGEIEPASEEDRSLPDLNGIEAAFKSSDADEIAEKASAIAESLSQVQAIEGLLSDRVGASATIDLGPLQKVLGEAANALAPYAKAADGAGEGAGADDEADLVLGAPAEGEPTVWRAAASAPGSISSPDDVIRTLDLICDYYAKNEPSSPLPLLLQRAKRLVSKDFMTILRDIAPDGVSDAVRVGGIKDDDDDDY